MERVEFNKGDLDYLVKLNDLAEQSTGLADVINEVITIRNQVAQYAQKQERLAIGDLSDRFQLLDETALIVTNYRQDAEAFARDAENAAQIAIDLTANLDAYLTDSLNAKADAETASSAAQAARVGIEDALAATETARDATLTAQADVETARDAALTAKNAAEAAQGTAEGAEGNALLYRNQAQTFRNEAEDAATLAAQHEAGALGHKNDASDSANLAATRTATAATYRDQARTYRDEAESAKNTAEAHKDAAKQYRDEAQTAAGQVNGDAYLEKTGGTLSGLLTIKYSVPKIHLEETDFTGSYFQVHKNGNNTFYYSSNADGTGDGVHIFTGRAFNTPGRLLVRETDGLKDVLHAGNYLDFIDPEDLNVPVVSYKVTRETLNDNRYLQPGFYTTSHGLPNKDNSAVVTSGWWHVLNFKHNDENGFNAQIAIELSNSGDPAKLRFRESNGGSWSDWYDVYTEINKPTPQEIGALASVNAGKTVAAWNGDNTLKLWSNSGTLEIGARNGAWCHFITNRPAFYFDKKIAAIEQVGVYGWDSYIGRTEGKINGKNIHHDGNNEQPFKRIYGDYTIQPFERVYTSTLDVYTVTIPTSAAGSIFTVSNGSPTAPIRIIFEQPCRAFGKVILTSDVFELHPSQSLTVLSLATDLFTII